MTENYAKLFHELTAKEGDVWHEWSGLRQHSCKCGWYKQPFTTKEELDDHIKQSNPTYDNAADILRVMRERDDWYKFIYKIGFDTTGHEIYNGSQIEYIDIEYILDPPPCSRRPWSF